MTVRSLSAADSGIATMQTELDTIGNNVANSSTDGYKETDVEFEDVLNEQLSPSGAATTTLASTDPTSIGAGSQVAGMQTNFSAGAATQTGVPTDAAIQGNGFFVVKQGNQTYFTRDGAFQQDVNGTLETASGATVQGWATGQPTTGPTTALTIPPGLEQAPQETANVTLGGNITSGGTTFTTTGTVYDAQGNALPLVLTYTPAGTDKWTVQASINGTNLFASGITETFNSSGQLQSYSVDGGATTTVTGTSTISSTQAMPASGQWAETSIKFVLPAPNSTTAQTQYATTQTAGITNQDGYAQGTLASWSIGSTGVITGTFSNGQSEALGTIALATFSNPGGLTNLGNLEFQTTAASGNAAIGTPGSGSAGTLLGGALEQSNVDLASQLTDLVEAQTNYEADTKVISTTQTVLQALVSNA